MRELSKINLIRKFKITDDNDFCRDAGYGASCCSILLILYILITEFGLLGMLYHIMMFIFYVLSAVGFIGMLFLVGRSIRILTNQIPENID